VVQAGDVESGLALLSVEEFPSFPNPIYQSTLPTKLLLSAIEKVEFAVAKHKNAMGYGYLLVDGDYRELIPKKFKTRIVLDIKELDRVLEEFSSVEEVVFYTGKGLKLTAKRVKDRKVKTIEVEIPATVEGQALSVAFNPKFVKEFTKANKGALEILLVDDSRPAVFKLGKNFLYLLIPKLR